MGQDQVPRKSNRDHDHPEGLGGPDTDTKPKLTISAATKALIKAVKNRRARFVLDAIAKNGMVSTEEISKAGYDHPLVLLEMSANWVSP